MARIYAAWLAVLVFLSTNAGAQLSDPAWSDSTIKPVHIAELLQNPDKYNDQVLRFYGVMSQQLILDRKTFVLTEYPQAPKGSSVAQQFLMAGAPGASIKVFFDTWYTNMSKTVDGRQRIRSIANRSDVTGGMFFVIAKVRLFSDTFQPYLDAVSLVPEEEFKEARNTQARQPETTPQRNVSAPVVPAGSLAGVCPAAKHGPFGFGTKCVGFYSLDDAKHPVLEDIEVSGVNTTKKYSLTKSLVHAGVDLVAAEGSAIYPISSGIVNDVIADPSSPHFGALGYAVCVEHTQQLDGKPVYSIYLHMKERPLVTVGQSVTGGRTQLGVVGQTGAAFGLHTHVEVRHFSQFISPKWNNIYGVERPAEERTFDDAEFMVNWINPASFAMPAPDLSIEYNDKFEQLATKLKNSERYPTSTADVDLPFDQAWDLVVNVLKKAGAAGVKENKAAGTIISAPSRVGFVWTVRYKTFAVLLEKRGDNQTHITYKIIQEVVKSDGQGNAWKELETNKDFISKDNQAFGTSLIKAAAKK